MGTRAGRVLNFGAVGNTNGVNLGPAKRRFGVFELDLRAGELRRSGLRIKLQEQPFQVLALLLEKPGEIVTRDDLRNRLWPADTFVDFDHSLNAAIKRLRDALGDSADNPTFVETVARRGYRFLAPVSTVSVNDNEESSSAASGFAVVVAETTSRPATGFHLWWMLGGGAAVILILIGIKLGLSLAQRPASQPQPRISQLTANPADDRVRTAAISRDGRYIAFSDVTGFYLREIDTGETHSIPLPAGFTATSVSWFPDSAHMVVTLNDSGETASLWEISTLGGGARKISDDGRSPSVSPDGTQIAFVRGTKMQNQIWLMAADGEQPRKLVGEQGDFFGAIAWSPEGTRVAYVKGRLSYAYGIRGGIELLNVSDQRVGTVVQLSTMGWFSAVNGPLAWTSDSHLIYSMAEAPPRQLDSNLWSIGIDPGGHPTAEPLRLTNDHGAVTSVTASGDGKRVAYIKGVPQPDVYVAKVDGPASISEPTRLTLDDRQDLPFDWMPDGKSVLFISDRTGIFSVYRQAVDQTVPELLVGGSRPVLCPRLSPDGSQILYLVYPSWTVEASSISLMRVPVVGGAPQEVLQTKWLTNQQCARAPATICLYSLVTNDTFALVNFDPFKGKGAQVYQVKDELPQLYNWSLSPDGSTLAIVRGKSGEDHPRIHLISLNGGDRWLSLEGLGVYALDWAADSKSLWAASVGDEENALLNIDLQGHTRVVWRPRKLSVYWAIPSRDGRSLALHVGSNSANVWMLERQ